MKIVYFAIIYLKGKQNPEAIEVHARPFTTRDRADKYLEKLRSESNLKDRITFSKVRKVDLAKYAAGIWI